MAGNNHTPRRPRRTRRNYNRASTSDSFADDEDDVEAPSPSARNSISLHDSLSLPLNHDAHNDTTISVEPPINIETNDSRETNNDDDDTPTIQIQILDSAQNRFHIPSVQPSTWTISRLKTAGFAIHNIPPDQQRLIYMGKLLNDETSTLEDNNIKNDGCIIHLFPKPKVVIDRKNESTETPPLSNNSNNHETAHIPQIVLDAEEAERRTHILVLSSHESFETLHRVRLCAFCLLVFSSMQLLQDLTLWIGPFQDTYKDGTGESEDDWYGITPGDPTDTTLPEEDLWGQGGDPNGGNDVFQEQKWERIDYLDVLLSVYSFYVAMYGIRVTTEHEIRTARLFWYMLVFLFLVWNGFYYMRDVWALKQNREKRGSGDGNDGSGDADDAFPRSDEMSVYTLAFWYESFVLFLWCVFLFWAYQFKALMEEAEMEAQERTRTLNAAVSNGNEVYGNDLELQEEDRAIT